MGGGAGDGRLLDMEFGVSVKWGQTMVTGLFLDALLGGGKRPSPPTPNAMWRQCLEFAKSHRDASPACRPVILAFCLAALNEGGFEVVGKFEGDNHEPTMRADFLEAIAAS